jgi:predicted PurR-regulated permease PerM
MSRSKPRPFPQQVVIATAIVAASVALIYLLLVLARVLLIVFAGVLMALFLGGGAKEIRRHTPLSRPVALAVVSGGVVIAGMGVAATVGPDLSGQINDLVAQLPDAVSRLRTRLVEQPWARRLAQNTDLISRLTPSPTDVVGGVTGAFSATLGYLTNGFIILFIGIYGAATPQPYVSGILHLVPSSRRERAQDVIDAVAHALRWWMVGRLTMMGVVGVLTGTGLWISGIPSPLALGLVAALLAFVPYVGPLLSMIPALLVALLVSGTKVLYVLIVYTLVQTLESYLITPLVQRRAVSLPPVILITAQIAMGVLAGATGVFLATPLAVTVIVLLQMLYVEDVLGDSVHILGQ